LGVTTNWITTQLQGRIPRRTIYDFLSGNTDARSEVVSALMEVLDLVVIVKSHTKRARSPGKEKPT
ncbi:MAG: hypothetical protein LLF76_10775, partial [Planctomycetaceae bacterium]|nr:hypothetical protein [Planctomycetaceae bacterium]